MATPIGAVNAMLRKAGLSKRAVSLKMGRAETYLGTANAKKNRIQADILAEIADVCGYQLQLVGHGETIVIDPPTRV